ncbi:MAG: two-component regulator propeller domain-containing protein [Bacteroides sp.]|jgi:ligand-binding sensor domain-containing protein|nr:two-component regulator propeller domain-containing protein [Bacteroides sp.]
MTNHKSLALILLFSIVCLLTLARSLSGKDIPVGHWRHHLPNNTIIALSETPEKIIGATSYGLVVFNKADNSVEKIDKVQGLTDFGITSLAYSENHDLLLVGYMNGNIDLIQGGQFFNVPDIRRSSIMGSKSINHILIGDERAYLACGFGIVEFDLATFLIRDTYFIGPQGSQVEVYDLVHSGTHFYAATNAGLLSAPAQGVNLADFQNWQKINVTGQSNELVNMVAWYEGNLFANIANAADDALYRYDGIQWQAFFPGSEPYSGTRRKLRVSGGKFLVSNDQHVDIFNAELALEERIDNYYEGMVRALDVLFDNDGTLWLGDIYDGLIQRVSPTGFYRIILPGPATPNAFGLAAGGDRLWVAPGAITSGGGNTWNTNGVFMFAEGQWTWFNLINFPVMDQVWDIIRVAVDPGNPQKIYAASWTEGLLEFTPEGPIALWDDTNSTLLRRDGIEDHIRLGGAAVDNSGNVWLTNSHTLRPIAVKKENNEWLSFSSQGLVSATQMVGQLIIDRSGQKWAALPNGGGIYVFNENNLNSDNDFQARRLTTTDGNGGLPTNNVISLVVDHDGYVWVGTDKGVAVFYAPQRAFSGEPINAQQIIVEQDGFAGILFETETINSIAVDGSNKKWFGTTRSGAFLLSSDGRETVFHFTAENSPLPSNNVLDIATNGKNGEVFFATDKGLVSFRGLATDAPVVHTDVYAFPNPVRPGYAGYISIRGLVKNAVVKITDINGNLVFETIAEGGQAIWNGQDLFGHRPSTGVYLVFSTNDDGSETMVTKILFVN